MRSSCFAAGRTSVRFSSDLHHPYDLAAGRLVDQLPGVVFGVENIEDIAWRSTMSLFKMGTPDTSGWRPPVRLVEK